MTRRRILTTALALLLTLTAGAIGYLYHLGYFGGPVCTLVPGLGEGDGTVAVFVSGDMGFNAGMGPRIAARLADAGIPVVGVNSLTAFARRRTLAQSDALVTAAVARAVSLPGARRVLLVGQSFGANVVLAGVPALPPALRAKIAMVELVVPADSMSFRATPGGVFDTGQDGPALPFAHRVTHIPVLCIHGEAEPGSLCPLWQQSNVATVTLPGDHFLHHDAALVAATLLSARRRY